MMVVMSVSVAGLQVAELEWTPCLITVREVTVLPAANVDLLTLNPALTSRGIYLTERKNIQLCNMDSLGNKTRDGS